MNVAISTIADDLDTDVTGIQTTITLFTLTMAALMIPGSKLTDIWGRKFCFIARAASIYGAGALLAALAQGLGLLTVGLLPARGHRVGAADPAHLHPGHRLLRRPAERAKWFGVVSGAAGLGSAAGPLIGGLITSYISWRASFLLQVLVVARDRAARPAHRRPAAARPAARLRRARRRPLGGRAVLRRLRDPADRHVRLARPSRTSASGVVIPEGGSRRCGCSSRSASWSSPPSSCTSARREQHGRTPLVSVSLFRNRTSNLGLVTQNVQWLVLQGSFFVISVFLQQERGYSAIQTGLMLLPATVGILLSSAAGPAHGQPAPPAAADPRRLHASPWSASPCCCSSPVRTRRSGRSGPGCS